MIDDCGGRATVLEINGLRVVTALVILTLMRDSSIHTMANACEDERVADFAFVSDLQSMVFVCQVSLNMAHPSG